MKKSLKVTSSILLFVILSTIVATVYDITKPFFNGLRIVKLNSCETTAIDNRKMCFFNSTYWQKCNDVYLEELNFCYHH